MCGIFGVYGTPRAAELTYLGLYALQHRGQESAGMAVARNGTLDCHLGMGLVGDVFTAEAMKRLDGHAAVGHTRYSTTGHSTIHNAQPLAVDTSFGRLAVAHNGNLVNSATLKGELLAQGHLFPLFHTTTDTEIILYLAARGKELRTALRTALRTVRGAYSLLFITNDALIAARDPNGFRPLALGRLPDGGWAVASETCAFDLAHAEHIRDIAPGEILHITKEGLRSDWIVPKASVTPTPCLFEFVYFARPDSTLEGRNVHQLRRAFGRRLAREHPVKADLVTPLPDSGNAAALGFSEEAKIPFDMALVRNHYVGRTFIQPSEGLRSAGVQIKINAVRQVIRGKRVVVIDDSIIRGTTARSRIQLLREAGAKEVHMRVSCPPTRHPCFYGIDFPTPGELIAAKKSVEEIRQFLSLDTLGYLSLEGMLECAREIGPEGGGWCTACWSGSYPVEVTDAFRKDQFEAKC